MEASLAPAGDTAAQAPREPQPPPTCPVFPSHPLRQSAQFFASRIVFEERHLRRLFGQEYAEYASRTPVYIPLLSLWGKFD